MDDLIRQGQWWWLLIPLGTGIFALLGSWLGPQIGSTHEHRQWLRNEKRKEYIAATDWTTAMLLRLDAIRDAGLEPLTAGKKLMDDDLKDGFELPVVQFSAPIAILSPEAVKDAMGQSIAAMRDYADAIKTAGTDAADSPLQKLCDETRERFLAASFRFVYAMRSDLGIKK